MKRGWHSFAVIAILLVFFYGCGKKADPIPYRVPKAISNLEAQHRGGIILRWSTDTDLAGFKVKRSERETASFPDCPLNIS